MNCDEPVIDLSQIPPWLTEVFFNFRADLLQCEIAVCRIKVVADPVSLLTRLCFSKHCLGLSKVGYFFKLTNNLHSFWEQLVKVVFDLCVSNLCQIYHFLYK